MIEKKNILEFLYQSKNVKRIERPNICQQDEKKTFRFEE